MNFQFTQRDSTNLISYGVVPREGKVDWIDRAFRQWILRPEIQFAEEMVSQVAVHPDRVWLASVGLRVLGAGQVEGLSPAELLLLRETNRALLWLAGYTKLVGDASHDPVGLMGLAHERLKYNEESKVLDVHALRARMIQTMPDLDFSTQSGLEILGNHSLISSLNEGQAGSRGESPRVLLDGGASIVIDFGRNEVHSAKRSAVRFGIPLELQLLGLLRLLAPLQLPIDRSLLINELWNEPLASKALLDRRFQKLVERLRKVQRIKVNLQSERAWSQGPCAACLDPESLANVVMLSDIQASRPGVFELGRRVSARLLQDYYGVSPSHARRIRRQLVSEGFIAG